MSIVLTSGVSGGDSWRYGNSPLGAGQTITGVIIALEEDQRIRRALAVAPSVHFYRYQISFKLLKG
jgi:hypothetical protein